MAPQRTRSLQTPCPRCGGWVNVVEVGIEVPEFPEGPVSWEPVKRYCANGCRLTVEDFPEG